MNDRRVKAYEETVGADARERQERLAREFLPCCGEHRDDGHHQECSKRPADYVAPAIEGQETIL